MWLVKKVPRVEGADLKEFIRFCAVGILNTAVDFAVFSLLTLWNVPLLAAHCVSYSCGILNSFFLNRSWTFRRLGNIGGQLSRFVVLNLITLTVTSGLLLYMRERWGLPVLSGKLIATGASVILNYTGNRLWVFSLAIYDRRLKEREWEL